MRTEWGIPRTECGCKDCIKNCRYMPGFLIPSDLARLIPSDVDALVWAETNLLASPGAVVMVKGEVSRVPTLVPATKPDGSCIHLIGKRCDIHQISPFGCAFFSCTPRVEDSALSSNAIMGIMLEGPNSLYGKIWAHLKALGLTQVGPEVARARMAQIATIKKRRKQT